MYFHMDFLLKNIKPWKTLANFGQLTKHMERQANYVYKGNILLREILGGRYHSVAKLNDRVNLVFGTNE